MKVLRKNLETTFTGFNDLNRSNRPNKNKKKSKPIWIDELRREGIESRGNAYPNSVAHCGYGDGMNFSADGNDTGVVFPVAKRQRRRRGRRSSPASNGANLRSGGEEDTMENESAGGWIAIYSGGTSLTDLADPTARIAHLSEFNGRILWRKSREIPTFRKIGTPSSENKLVEHER